LKKFKPHSSVVDLYKVIIGNAYKKQSAQQQNGSKQLVDEMNKINERLNKARQLLLSEDIDPIDYRTIKSECEDKLMRLEAKLAETTTTNVSATIGIDKLIDKAVSTLSRLDIIYTEADVIRKREIIGSIYLEKLSFDGFQYRTARVNEAGRLIFQINNELEAIKYQKGYDVSHLSGWVERTGAQSNPFSLFFLLSLKYMLLRKYFKSKYFLKSLLTTITNKSIAKGIVINSFR
nr:hypothetical protein [Segetibacter sp.]